MKYNYKNLVFSGGGVLGIAYIGALEYLCKTHLITSFINLAGTSAGAITACLACFNLPFNEFYKIMQTLDYKKVPVKDSKSDEQRIIPQGVKDQFNSMFDNIDCVSRLIKSFGWYSSDYIYSWLKEVIATQFDPAKKKPPYTFSDFQNPSLHINQNPFKNLYITGTDIEKSASTVFSYETTPNMEVADAVRISMSVPLFFEAIKTTTESASDSIYVDGGLLYNYPITLFDQTYPSDETLGLYFKSSPRPRKIKTLVDFIAAALSCGSNTQNQLFLSNPKNLARSICIQTGDISSLDFNISFGDSTYRFLYEQGYRAVEIYFSLLNS